MMISSPKQAPPTTWRSHTFRAMGSEMAVWLDTDDESAAADAFAQVEALFERNEQALSRFRPDSELSRLNGRSGRWVELSALMWDVLKKGLALAEQSGGRFDPTLLRGIRAAGYSRSFGLPPLGAAPSGRQPLSGRWQEVELDEAKRAMRLPAGAGLDFGGLAKGYTAQKAVEVLRPLGGCLVDAGGDLVAGPCPRGFPGWPVAIAGPWQERWETADLAELWLAEEALATSGIDFRSWVWEGQVMHHLLDPATGRPAVTDGLTVTVLAPQAADAEGWATAALVAGSAVGLTALQEKELAGLFVTQDGRVLLTPAMRGRLGVAETFPA